MNDGWITTLATQMYFEALKDLDIKDIERATMELVRSRVYSTLPKPAEI